MGDVHTSNEKTKLLSMIKLVIRLTFQITYYKIRSLTCYTGRSIHGSLLNCVQIPGNYSDNLKPLFVYCILYSGKTSLVTTPKQANRVDSNATFVSSGISRIESKRAKVYPHFYPFFFFLSFPVPFYRAMHVLLS